MDPTVEEMVGFTDMSSIFEWLEAEDPFVTALKSAVGASTLTFRTWARIPAARFSALKDSMQITEGESTRPLSPI